MESHAGRKRQRVDAWSFALSVMCTSGNTLNFHDAATCMFVCKDWHDIVQSSLSHFGLKRHSHTLLLLTTTVNQHLDRTATRLLPEVLNPAIKYLILHGFIFPSKHEPHETTLTRGLPSTADAKLALRKFGLFTSCGTNASLQRLGRLPPGSRNLHTHQTIYNLYRTLHLAAQRKNSAIRKLFFVVEQNSPALTQADTWRFVSGPFGLHSTTISVLAKHPDLDLDEMATFCTSCPLDLQESFFTHDWGSLLCDAISPTTLYTAVLQIESPRVVEWIFAQTQHVEFVRSGVISLSMLRRMRAPKHHRAAILSLVAACVLECPCADCLKVLGKPNTARFARVNSDAVAVELLLSHPLKSVIRFLCSVNGRKAVEAGVLDPSVDVLGTDCVIAGAIFETMFHDVDVGVRALSSGLFTVQDALKLPSSRHLRLVLSPDGLTALNEKLLTMATIQKTKDSRKLETLLSTRGIQLLRKSKNEKVRAVDSIVLTDFKPGKVPTGSASDVDAILAYMEANAQYEQEKKDAMSRKETMYNLGYSRANDASELGSGAYYPVAVSDEVATLDNEVPSPEKLQVLEHFMEVTGITDEQKAIKFLCTCSWNVETAVSLHYATLDAR